MRSLAKVLSFILVLGFLAGGCGGKENPVGKATPYPTSSRSITPQPFIGYPAPDFSLSLLGGGTVKLSDLRGKPIFLNVWSVT